MPSGPNVMSSEMTDTPALERFRKSCSGPPLSSPLSKGGKRGVARYTKTDFALAPSTSSTASIAAFYSLYLNELIYFARRIVPNRQDAEDVVNDVFARVLELGSSHPIKNLPAFIRTAIRNRSIDYIRRAKAVQLDPTALAAPTGAPVDELHEFILAHAGRKAADVFVRRFYGDRNKDIAREWGVSDATVTKLFKKASALLSHAASAGLLTILPILLTVLCWIQRALWGVTSTTARRLRRWVRFPSAGEACVRTAKR
ncbi:MAG: sigma-70 family RNA polymerase sigma factor, partial [Planctomycetes bacterium]|nr:sigma-70 family RNA polymerase sigma factor [Planctomycetota bacterium]